MGLFAVDIIQYNAAVDYLNSLGIAVEDLSDYSHKEIKEAAKTIDAGESNPLTEEILSLIPENKEPLDTPTQVTSEQIKELTPTIRIFKGSLYDLLCAGYLSARRGKGLISNTFCHAKREYSFSVHPIGCTPAFFIYFRHYQAFPFPLHFLSCQRLRH